MLFFLNFLLTVTVVSSTNKGICEADLADHLNRVQTSFIAKSNAANHKFKVMDPIFSNSKKDVNVPVRSSVLASLPSSFDSRVKWPNCASIQLIRDQSNCGACWAFASAEVISDRTCIESNGAQQPIISTEDILTCCGEMCGWGCRGGYIPKAFDMWVTKGVVTGGDFGGAGCKPYSFAPCSNCASSETTPLCSETCQSSYATEYPKDKLIGDSFYYISSEVAAIQSEILTNGPIAASFDVYEDFYCYTSGIYKHTSGGYLGGHAVKIIGWGSEDGKDYWLITNSWGEDFGENGFFRMIRGTNDCKIEENLVAGLAKKGFAGANGLTLCIIVVLGYFL